MAEQGAFPRAVVLSKRSSLLPCLSHLHLIFEFERCIRLGWTDETVQVGPRYAEAAGGQRFVPIVLSNGLLGHVELEFAKLFFKRTGSEAVDNAQDISFLNGHGQICHADGVTGGGDDGPLYDVLQFAHISRPRIVLEQGERGGLNALHRFLEHLRVLPKKMRGDLRDVLGMILEQRCFDAHDIHAVVKILSELPLRHHFGQVLIGGEQQARPQRNEPIGAQARELAFLQDGAGA